MTDSMNRRPRSTKQLWGSVGLSFFVALIIFLVFVLPAEFGEDPSGLGDLMGIDGISAYNVGVLSIEDEKPASDEIVFTLEPFESIEYKYVLGEAQSLIFSWEADGEVVFDFHSEEEGTDPEDAMTFDIGKSARESGTYVAPFAGIHGWFWENRGSSVVQINLVTKGYFDQSITYSPSGKYKREF